MEKFDIYEAPELSIVLLGDSDIITSSKDVEDDLDWGV